MTTETLFSTDRSLRFKIIRPVYEILTVNDAAAEYFEPLEAISSSSQVVRFFGFLGKDTDFFCTILEMVNYDRFNAVSMVYFP